LHVWSLLELISSLVSRWQLRRFQSRASWKHQHCSESHDWRASRIIRRRRCRQSQLQTRVRLVARLLYRNQKDKSELAFSDESGREETIRVSRFNVYRDRCDAITVRPMDRLHLRCFKAERDLRRNVSNARIETRCIREWRLIAAMESRRKATVF